MVEPIKPELPNSDQELVRQHNLDKLDKYFANLIPGRVALTMHERKRLEEVYNIGLKYAPEDPIAWVKDFERNVPLKAEIDEEPTRLGQVHVMAHLYATRAPKTNEMKQARREF